MLNAKPSLPFLFHGLFLFFPLCNFGFCFWPTTVPDHSGCRFSRQQSGLTGPVRLFRADLPCLGAGRALEGGESCVCGETRRARPAAHRCGWESASPECPCRLTARPRCCGHSQNLFPHFSPASACCSQQPWPQEPAKGPFSVLGSVSVCTTQSGTQLHVLKGHLDAHSELRVFSSGAHPPASSHRQDSGPCCSTYPLVN